MKGRRSRESGLLVIARGYYGRNSFQKEALHPGQARDPRLLKTHRVLEFHRDLRVLSPEVIASPEVLHPALTKDKEKIVSPVPQSNARGLETKIFRSIVELDQIGE